MLSRDIAWLTIAGVLGIKILSGVAMAGEHPVFPTMTGGGATAISQPSN